MIETLCVRVPVSSSIPAFTRNTRMDAADGKKIVPNNNWKLRLVVVNGYIDRHSWSLFASHILIIVIVECFICPTAAAAATDGRQMRNWKYTWQIIGSNNGKYNVYENRLQAMEKNRLCLVWLGMGMGILLSVALFLSVFAWHILDGYLMDQFFSPTSDMDFG